MSGTASLDDMRVEFTKHLNDARSIVEDTKAKGEDLSAEDEKVVLDHIKAAAALKERIAPRQRDDALAAQLDALAGTGPFANVAAAKAAQFRSLGERVAGDERYQSWLKSFPNGRIPEGARGLTAPSIDVPELGAMAMRGEGKILTDSADLTGSQRLIPPDYRGIVTEPYWPVTGALDLVTRGTTQSDTIYYVRIGTLTNTAVVVPETLTSAADATPTTAEGFKPESDFTFTPAQATVYTIAHWVAATKQALSDFGQLRTLIDSFLLSGMRDKLDSYVLSGTGTGEPQGILTAAAANTQAFTTDIVTSIRKGITYLANKGVRPNAVVMNPANSEALDLLQSSAGVYYFGGGPSGAPTAAPVWGLRRVDDPKMTSGFALVGDFSKAVLWDREQASITATDSHADFFIRNLVAVLGEMRAAFATIQPDAFCIVDIVSP